jgi:hypothetical protein
MTLSMRMARSMITAMLAIGPRLGFERRFFTLRLQPQTPHHLIPHVIMLVSRSPHIDL